ncbi:type VII secretion integral membrane protein EccD [Kribbella sp. NPDC051620]|uniref:type VII secretion integral membrane protein EccD n=1 Tax=Kribbella sp. NPDC051620 TaxID=3364120 RepID=UPI0037BC8647
MNITGLVRVTITAPQRRLDLALPEQASVAEILPGILAKAGENLADAGVPEDGWVLRTADGLPLALGRTLGSHRIKDGEILHLVPRRTEWPELEYDDLVDAVAAGSGRLGAPWAGWHTRGAGLTAAAVALLVVLVTVLRAGTPWSGPAGWLLLLAPLLVAAAVTLARVVGDAGAGVLIGAAGLMFAAVGGGLLLAGAAPRPAIGAPQLLTGSAALVLAGVACYLGVVDGGTLFAAAMSAGLLGVIAGWIGTADSLGGSDVAAVVGTALLAFSPLLASLAIRLGRLPMPILPRSTADLVRDDPQPPRRHVYGAVVRADGLLSGMLAALMLVLSICLVLLLQSQTRSATLLVILLTVGSLIRARLYPIVKQRSMLLIPGLVGAAGLVIGPLSRASADPVVTVVPLLLVLAALIVFVGLRYSTRPANPYLSRYAELLEILIVLSLIPVVCSVLGLYGVVRGWGG